MSHPVIDFHVHVFPDALAPAAMERLQAFGGVPAYYDGTLAGLRQSMAKSQVTHAVIQPVATKPTQVETINRWSVELNQEQDLIAFGSLHPDMTPAQWSEAIAFLKIKGLRGIKMHPEYQNFYPDDPKLAELYAAVQEADLVLLLHAGVDLGYPPPVKATPRRLLEVHKGFPDLKMVLAHLGGYRLWEEVGKYLVGTGVWLDTAYCFALGALDPAALEVMRHHGPDKILFASDGPWGDQRQHLENLRKINLTSDLLRSIESTNAERLLQGKPAGIKEGGRL